MSKYGGIDAIIQTLLRCDEEPPDEDYSPLDFGATLAQSLSPAGLRDLACAILRRLPSSLASSVLEGLLATSVDMLNPQLMFDEIATGSQLDTGATIVELLVSRFEVAPDDVSAELFRRLLRAHDAAVQDRYAFALWALFCGETVLIKEGKTVGYLVSAALAEIDVQLLRSDLSEYSKATLRACRSASQSTTSADGAG